MSIRRFPATGNVSAFDAGGNPFEAPYYNYKPGYLQQFNLDVQRQLGWGWFIDAAYAGSRGVHLANSNNVSINNIPDSFYAQAEQQSLANQPVTITSTIPNPFTGDYDCKRIKSDEQPYDYCGSVGPSLPPV